jgi:hypothetical protein
MEQASGPTRGRDDLVVESVKANSTVVKPCVQI